MFKKVWTKKFWQDLGERTARTFVQGVAAFATGITLDMVKADVKSVVVGGLLAGAAAVITGLIAAFKNPEQQSASLLDQPVVTEPGHHNGSQAPYDAASEAYGDKHLADAGLPIEGYYNGGPGAEPFVPVRSELPPEPEYTDGPTDLPPPPYQTQSLIDSNKPIPQRGPNGRFLPRNQGDF